jgi:hypothetical protein
MKVVDSLARNGTIYRVGTFHPDAQEYYTRDNAMPPPKLIRMPARIHALIALLMI